MSNRDPRFNDSNKNSAGASRNDDLIGSPGDVENAANKSKDRAYEGLEKADKAANQAQDKLYDGLHKADDMANDAQSKMNEGRQKADEVAGMARERADQGMDKAADGMDKAAGMLRDRGQQQGGTMGSMAGTAADAMETAGSYLHDTSSTELMDQVEAYIRKNPTQSLLIAAGVGFVLAKAFK